MPFILYIKNRDTGDIRQVDGVFPNEKAKNRARRRLEKDMIARGLDHISIHEKKIK